MRQATQKRTHHMVLFIGNVQNEPVYRNKVGCGFQELVSENGDGLQMRVSLREKMSVLQ